MNLKRSILPEMVIHCTTEEEANTLLQYLDTQGYVWVGGTKLTERNNYSMYEANTCYHLHDDKRVSFADYPFLKKNYHITKFSDCVIETEELTAVDVLIWLKNYRLTGVYKKVFGQDYALGSLLNDFSAEEIVERIRKYEFEPEEYEWVHVCRIIQIHDNGKKECVYEQDVLRENPCELTMSEVENIYQQYISLHKGKYIATIEYLYRVKENK